MKRMANQLVLAAMVAATMVACSGSGEKQPQQGAAQPAVTGVGMVTVIEETVPTFLEVMGTVKARNAAVVAARVPGTISVLRVREGDRVRKGQLLAQLESGETAAGAVGAQAAVDEAKRGLEEAKTRKKLADVTYERYQKLFAEQAVTRQEFDSRQTERDLAQQGVARAEARLKQVQESFRAAGTLADYTRIVAPIGGVVTVRQAELGATVFPGQPLLTVEEEGNYLLELAVPETAVAKVHGGEVVKIAMDGAPPVDGRITEVVPAVDPMTRTFLVKAAIPGHGARSGMFGRAQLVMGSTRGIFVPRQSVREQGSLTSVWVVDKDNRARMRLVKVGKGTGDKVEILTGLSSGERVVTTGADRVVEGAPVQGAAK